ncbi:hypothetical protein [Saccharopolyspora shandongensis]|uniref:hypothetical protein n=1 Tax=Saccharopolyspora shandongensis TaxID=418495 RepID=UPI0033E950A0
MNSVQVHRFVSIDWRGELRRLCPLDMLRWHALLLVLRWVALSAIRQRIRDMFRDIDAGFRNLGVRGGISG